MNNKIGLMVFGNQSGIGYQTKRLAELIKPDRILFVDSSGFSKNTKQFKEWYAAFRGYYVSGFPNDHEIKGFLRGLTHVFCVENPLNYNLTSYAEKLGIKVYIQTNYEFCDFLDKRYLTLPYKFIMPSYWKIAEMEQIFGRDKVMYLPPPINPHEFKQARDINFNRSGRNFLHIAGTIAAHDRNGTLDLLAAVQQTQEEFDLTIASQHELPPEYLTFNRKVNYKIGSVDEPCKLYKDYDALILPRRYGGLSLPVQEALMSGLPVIMTDISPNKELLPAKWLVNARKKGDFRARTMIDVYTSDIVSLASRIDALVTMDLEEEKIEAFDIGFTNFADSQLKGDYERLFI